VVVAALAPAAGTATASVAVIAARAARGFGRDNIRVERSFVVDGRGRRVEV
jgi:hypothetical protein